MSTEMGTGPITRKPRGSGSVALTIPRDFAAEMDLRVGDLAEVERIDSQHLRIRRAGKLAAVVKRRSQPRTTSNRSISSSFRGCDAMGFERAFEAAPV